MSATFVGMPAHRPVVILAYPKIDHEKDYVYFWMPFSLLTTANPLLDTGLADVVLFDGNQAEHGAWERLLDEHLGNTLCIGVSVMTGGGQIAHALDLVRRAKNRDGCPPVVFGGPHVNVLAEQTADDELVDAVLVGPGQHSMPVYVEALLGKRPLADVPGLIVREGGKDAVRGPVNPPRTSSLGRYPWHLLDVPKYIRSDPTVASRTLNYISSQGCVYKCRFCYELTYQRKYSSMQAHDMVEDLHAMQHQFGINGVKFYDADWFVNIKRAVGFCEELIDRNMDLAWAASINPNDVLKARRSNTPLLKRVAESGCTRLLMGVESGSNRVLQDVVKKEITREGILDVAAEIADNGILGSYTFIVGFPGESPQEQDDTYRLIEELRDLSPTPESRVHLFAPYPGTPLYDEALAHGFEPPDTFAGWANYDYYDTQTPWTSKDTVARARAHTMMRLSPTGAAQSS
ncbi:B12-binding domain-containing radical SAM protein [Streptomyces sp. NPDC050085]|uniref:B12-binding domain-containing radical SAM protein n=1 Tax=Streptomyces sp. NPDC050085 TaxID=3365600 RepID=UPI003791AAD7